MAVTEIPHVREARSDDFEAILAIGDLVAVALLARGIRWNPNVLTRAHLADWLRQGALFVAETRGEVIGSVAVWRRDPDGWWPAGDRAGYIRDLMIAPRLRGQGVGAKTLLWAENYLRGLGHHMARLDCLASNERLCRYYSNIGYQQVGVSEVGMAYFEKALG